MHKKFLVLFIATFFSITTFDAFERETDFFTNPKILSSDDISNELDSKSLGMCWQFGELDLFHFISEKDNIYFEIIFDKIPDFYSESTKNLFIEKSSSSEQNKKKYHIFTYEWKKDDLPVFNKPREHKTEPGANTSSYLVDKRRIFEQSTPQVIKEEEIASVIANKNFLFYTGAGLSVASDVPSMNQLNELLGFQSGEKFASSLETALQRPEEFSQKILTFHNACYFSPPTAAHKALTKLAIYKNTKIITENLDCLHEYSGILPYRINAEEIRAIGGCQLSDIEYIICIGLSYDDKGFLGWYKNNNPNGKIISVDLGNPSYLGDEDFIIHADLQVLIPSLANQTIPKD